MLTIIRSPLFKFIGIILFVFINYAVIYTAGERNIQTKWDYEKANTKAVVEVVRVVEEKITKQIDTVYVDRIKEVKVKGDTIVKYIPQYISQASNDHCRIDNGFVLLHNAAATNTIPRLPDETDGEASGISLSDVEETVATNYTTCNAIREQVIGLQDWIREQKAARNN